MNNDIAIKGIFKNNTLSSNQVEFCILSDVHIASKDRNDYVFSDNGTPLSCEAYMLKILCENIKYSAQRRAFYDNKHYLIFLGDIVNGGECGYFDCYNSYAYKYLIETIIPWLYTGNILYFAGNHDRSAKLFSDLAKFPKKSVIETIEDSTRRDFLYTKCGIIFEHGNKFDYLCNGKNFLGLMGDFASNIVVSACSQNMEDVLRGRSFYYNHSSDNSIRMIPKDTEIKTMNNECRRVANGALRLLSKHSDYCHTIVCGHTHQHPVKVVVNDNGYTLTYYNTGKFARDAWLNLTVEQTDVGKWKLVE
jgi:UDP-2,3-diacylglucosamine pyrophosphatase LpxH